MLIRLPSAELKRIIKKLSAAHSSSITIDGPNGAMISADEVLGVVVTHESFKGDQTISLPTKMFSSMISALSGEITIQWDGGPVHISTGKSKYELAILPPKKLTLQRPDCDPTIFPAKELREALGFAGISSEENQNFRYTSCILLTEHEGKVRVAGTDTHRLTIYDTEIPSSSLRIIVPSRSVKAVREMDGNEIKFSENERMQLFESGNVCVFSKQLVGGEASKFPDPSKFIPQTFKTEIQISSESLKECLHRVAPVLENEDGTNRRRVTFEFEEDCLKISAGTSVGRIQDVVPITTILPDVFDGPRKFQVVLNHADIVEFAEAAPGTIRFCANEKTQPVWFECGSKKMLEMPFAK